MSTPDCGHHVPRSAKVSQHEGKSISAERRWSIYHSRESSRPGKAEPQCLCAKMKAYRVSKRNITIVCTVIVFLGLIISLDDFLLGNFVSYSKFNYPIEMDYITKYEAFKTYGRRSSLKMINPHPFEYIHLKGGCEFKVKGQTTLLILVKSAVFNFHLRDAIRRTWGNVKENNVEIMFMLAYHADLQPEVDREVMSYDDIIQESFIDTYMNNTYKTIMGFNWAVQYCREATHVVFVDDDHYLSIRNILNFIDKLDVVKNDRLMVGNLHPTSIPFRSKFSKWYVSYEQYPFDSWPPYLAGAVYIVSQEVARKMVFAFPYVKYIGIDDAYLGIVARKIGIEPQHEARLMSPPYLLYTDPTQMVYGEFKNLEDFQTVHRYLQNVDTVKMCVFTWKCQFVFLL